MTAAARSLRSWARRVAALASGPDQGPGSALDAVRAVVVSVSRALPVAPMAPDGFDGEVWFRAKELASALPEPPRGWADAWLPGVVDEQAISGERRSARGAWYTPESVVRGLVALATADGPPATAVDPTCGGGAFLLAALDRYVELGFGVDEALARVAGTDLDPDAVWTSRWSVALWAASHGSIVDPDLMAVAVADALVEPGPSVSGQLVIGNPPFATPLRTGRLPETAEAYREANRDLLGPYSDLAAVHLLAAIRSAGDGSTVAMVLPQSVLSGRDTHGLRQYCDERAPLQALWASRESVFDAGVRACAVVLRCGGTAPREPALAAGASVRLVERHDPAPTVEGWWGWHAARALGAPALPPPLVDLVLPAPTGHGDVGGRPSTAELGRLGDLATATAGFRDEYYGLVAACREWDGADGHEPNRLATVGSVDPLVEGWGRTGSRLGGRRWCRPTVDLETLDDRVRGWVTQRLVPKVVLATQSKVLEPVVDRTGRLVPVTPLIAVTADPADLDRLAAVLLAPPVVAWAWQRWFGSALSVEALKLAARQVLELPLPRDRLAWDEASALVRAADGADPDGAAVIAGEVARIMNHAYGAGDEVLSWWAARAVGRSGEGARTVGEIGG